MHMIIDGSPLGSGRGGDETYARSVIAGLSQASRSNGPDRISVIRRAEPSDPYTYDDNCDDANDGGTPIREFTVAAQSGAAFYGRSLPRALRSLDGDAALCFTHAPIRRRSATPVLLAVLDLSFEHLPNAYPRRTRARLRTLVRHQVRRAEAVMTISDWSKRDLVNTYSLDPHRVFVVPGAVTPPIPIARTDESDWRSWRNSLGITSPYVLALGNLHPRKNIATAIRAYAGEPRRAGLQLVIAGARWWGNDESTVMQQCGLHPNDVILVGRVTDAQREVLLRGARCLVYPSLFEGFGLPPIEAMARGIPVVASNATALPEVLGDAALLVDPYDAHAMGAALMRAALCPSTRADLQARGLARSAMWTTERTGEAARTALASTAQPGAITGTNP